MTRTTYKKCKSCGATYDVGAFPDGHCAAVESKAADASALEDPYSMDRPMIDGRATFRKCSSCGGLHDVNNWPDNHREWVPDNRSELAAPMVVSDSLDYMESQFDGKRYTSKRRYRAELRGRGYVEVGNENPGAHRARKDGKAHRTSVNESLQRAVSQHSMRKPTLTKKQARKARRKERAST